MDKDQSRRARDARSRRGRRARSRTSAALLLAALGSSLATKAGAQARAEVIIRDAGQRDADGAILVDLRQLNEGDAPATMALADRIEARLVANGSEQRVWLERDQAGAADRTVLPGGFAQARYRLRVPGGAAIQGAILSIPALSRQQIVVAERAYAAPMVAGAEPAAQAPGEVAPAPQAAPPPADRSAGNQFLGNFSAYQPIYAVYGPGTNSEARLQISFKYRLFGISEAGAPGAGREGLHFAYTQRMFWDLGAESLPFRNIDFQPELFYLTPSRTLASGASFSAQAGFAHESNGRDGVASRSLNSLYLAPMAAFPLGDGYRLSVAPRLSLLVGSLSDNPDIRRYRGNAGLSAEIGKDDGLRLTTATRFNFATGKGAVSADLSYPLPRILSGMPSLYLFGQSFVGYGENLLDYDRRATRLRLGVALVR